MGVVPRFIFDSVSSGLCWLYGWVGAFLRNSSKQKSMGPKVPGCRLHVEAPENVPTTTLKIDIQPSYVTNARSKASDGYGAPVPLPNPLPALLEPTFSQAHLEASSASVYRL